MPSDVIVPVVFDGPVQSEAVSNVLGALDAITVHTSSPTDASVQDRAPSEDVNFRKMRPPKYPPAAIAAKQSGKVVLKVLINELGEPESAEVYDSKPTEAAQIFGDTCIVAAMQWRFNPGMRDGKPYAGYALIPFNFELHDDEDDKPAAKAADNG